MSLQGGNGTADQVPRSLDEVVIRTPDQRMRVFVSSTLDELADERQAVSRAIASLRLTPVMFELGARPHRPPRQRGGLIRADEAASQISLAS